MLLTILLAVGAPVPVPATAKAECVFEAGNPARATALMQWAGSPDFAAKAGLRGAKLGLWMEGTTVRLVIHGAREGTALEVAASAAKLVTDEPGKAEMASLVSAFDQARRQYDFEDGRLGCKLGRMA